MSAIIAIILSLSLSSALYVAWCLLFDYDEPERREPNKQEVWRLVLLRMAKPN